jgi:DNA-binding MarR family transcriptional regulator
MPNALDETRRAVRRRSLLHPLQRIALHFRDSMRAGLRARGHTLQPAHAGVIIHLPTEGARLTDLAARAAVSKQAMGKLVDELEAIGYVEREADPDDGRGRIVHFSRKGETLLRDAGEIVEEIWQRYADVLGERRLARLHGDLRALCDAIDQIEVDDARAQVEGARHDSP